MATKYVVKQQVASVKEKWLVELYDTTVEQLAIEYFEKLRAEHPGTYFEVVKIEHQEVCLHYTPFVGD